MKKVLCFVRARIRKVLLEEIWLDDYIKRGMKVGKNFNVQPRCVFDYSHCHLIKIGDNVTLAPEVYILAHDASTKRELGYTKVGNVVIEDNVFIGARSIIMLGVTIGENSIVGTGSIVTKSIPKNSVVAGNPARVICSYDEYIRIQNHNLEGGIKFEEEYALDKLKSLESNRIMFESIKYKNGFVR